MVYNYQEWADILGSMEMAAKYVAYCEKFERKKRTGGRSAFKDADQSRVYRAERKARAAWKKAGISVKEFSGYKAARDMTDRVLKSKLWKEMAGHRVKITEKKDMGHRSAVAGLAWHNEIQLCPRYGLNMATLLHELAHSAGHTNHSITFRKAHVKLVSRFIGQQAAKIMKEAYKEEGLKMIVRQRAMMTPSEWLEKHDKMALLREKQKKWSNTEMWKELESSGILDEGVKG
jgi:hypothetical protein